MTSLSRRLLDLPDEILCMIFAYCCQDLDFLLWPCPLVTVKGQFSHDCYHCALYHGQANSQVFKISTVHRSLANACVPTCRNSNNNNNNNNNNISINNDIIHSNFPRKSDNISTGASECNSSDTDLRKRRRRWANGLDYQGEIAAATTHSFLGFRFGFGGPSPRGAPGSKYQWSGNGRLYDHHLESCRQHGMSTLVKGSLLSRNFTRTPSFAHIRSQSCSQIRPTSASSASLIPIASAVVPQRSRKTLEAGSSLAGTIASASASSLVASSVSADAAAAAATTTPSLLISLAESIPLPQGQLYHAAPLQSSKRDKRSTDHSLLDKCGNTQNAHTTPSHAVRFQKRSWPFNRNLNGTSSSYFQSINRRQSLSTSGMAPTTATAAAGAPAMTTKTLKGNTCRSGFDTDSDAGRGYRREGAIQLAAPFQMLLVSRRFADLVVPSLWKNIAFHGHDLVQMQSLLSALCKVDTEGQEEEHVVAHSHFRCTGLRRQFKEFRHESARLIDRKGAVAETGPSFISNGYCSWTTSLGRDLYDSAGSGSEQGLDTIVRPRTSTIKAEASPVSKTSPVQGRSRKRNPAATLLQRPSVTPSWSYRRFVKHVVLNFAHPEASPQMLVKVLECIGSRCQDQIQALDLYANEKMRAAGLESSADLERLFGSGFSKLRFLRLQGGFVDNQLLGALVKGLTPLPEFTCAQYEAVESDPSYHVRSNAVPRLRPQCQLSQVFLGPGSVTDSAIEKLIVAASHCLEVFSVTSCVDVSGGALASLLTRCPELRVLSVHKSLASDKELFKGLGIEDDASAPNPPRKTIIAPLERLELGTIKLTTAGVMEIIKGTCNTLRFLSLGPRHFKEDFLRNMVTTTCSRLEGIHFDDPDRSPVQTQQLHQMSMQQPLAISTPDGGQQPRRRFFSFGRNRRAIDTEAQYGHQVRYQQQQQQQSDQATDSHAHLQQTHSPREMGSMQRRSAWLGEPSTEEWVLYGGCALWAASSSGMNAILKHHPGVIHLDGSDTRHSSRSAYRPRSRNLSTFFQGIGDHLKALFPNRSNNVHDNHSLASTGPIIAAHDLVPFSGHKNGFEGLLERYEVYQSTIDTMLQSLQPSLKSFMVMQTDLILENARIHNAVDTTDTVAMDKRSIAQSHDAIPVDRLETFLKLVVILGVLAFGAALAIAAAAQKSFYNRVQ
ncbi:hypothetical protein BG011_006332 [Mortierella polycephala]|uniref:Uncharacterized protein n=1 Tax=Mortierella polycephala TaxID=41804 RepID=A0A9P6PT47_9FUNG|nr:hypothetical protein BG011_006332 [Mortierella polycephala]